MLLHLLFSCAQYSIPRMELRNLFSNPRTISSAADVLENMDTVKLVRLVRDLGGIDDPAVDVLLGVLAGRNPQSYQILCGHLGIGS